MPPPGQEPPASPAAPGRSARRRWRAVLVVFTVAIVVLFGALAAGFGAVISGGAGERTYRPTEWGARAGYELGVGELVLDLTALPPLTEDRSVSLDLGMGQVRVILPPELDVELEAHAGMGEIVPPAGPDESQDGVDVTLTTRDDGDAPAGAAGGTASDTSGGDDGPVLHLAAEVGMGQVEVTRR
ncbi:MAG: hypothetical protein R2755_33805 [Acidimicrobiales bacterium]